MLGQLLKILQQGGTRRVTDLAQDLGTTPELIEMMLEDLVRMGYLKRVGGECPETSCKACPLAGLCAAGSSGQLWSLTEKGEAQEITPL